LEARLQLTNHINAFDNNTLFFSEHRRNFALLPSGRSLGNLNNVTYAANVSSVIGCQSGKLNAEITSEDIPFGHLFSWNRVRLNTLPFH
jgi:hypothetical protein